MNQHLDTTQAARYLNVARRTLERWRLINEGPPFRKFGRRTLYNIQELESWAENQSYDPAREGANNDL